MKVRIITNEFQTVKHFKDILADVSQIVDILCLYSPLEITLETSMKVSKK